MKNIHKHKVKRNSIQQTYKKNRLGWLYSVLTILLRVEQEPLSETGSSEASGDVAGDVDMGEPAPMAPFVPPPIVPSLPSSRSRTGFLLRLGEVKGLERPIVANF